MQNASFHAANILKERELDGSLVVKDYLITALDAELADIEDLELLSEAEYLIKNR